MTYKSIITHLPPTTCGRWLPLPSLVSSEEKELFHSHCLESGISILVQFYQIEGLHVPFHVI